MTVCQTAAPIEANAKKQGKKGKENNWVVSSERIWLVTVPMQCFLSLLFLFWFEFPGI